MAAMPNSKPLSAAAAAALSAAPMAANTHPKIAPLPPPPLPASRALAIVEAEVGVLTMAMKRGQLWSRSSSPGGDSLHPALLGAFLDLKRALASAKDLAAVDPSAFLAPFLAVVRSETVTGPVTGMALAAVCKFLSYGVLHPGQAGAAHAVEGLADAVTHARFVGVDPSSDEIVLMKILEVLRTLLLSPVGLLLTNESVCEIMQSTFRICFETRLSELLRKMAEHTLDDMIHMLFSRLPTFTEENLPLLKKLKMRNHGDSGRSRRKHHHHHGSSSSSRHRSKPAASPARPNGGTQAQAGTSTSKSPAASAAAQGKDEKPRPKEQEQPQQPESPRDNSSLTAAASDSVSAASPARDDGSNAPAGGVAPASPAPPPSAEKQFSVDHDVLARWGFDFFSLLLKVVVYCYSLQIFQIAHGERLRPDGCPERH